MLNKNLPKRRLVTLFFSAKNLRFSDDPSISENGFVISVGFATDLINRRASVAFLLSFRRSQAILKQWFIKWGKDRCD